MAPGECSHEQLLAFATVAAKGEEVKPPDIKSGAERAAFLLWIGRHPDLAAVAALKRPYENYKRRVFKKAGVYEKCGEYDLEFGYLFVAVNQRRKGYGRLLARKCVVLAEDRALYATTRANNGAMQAILEELGFSTLGSDYTSERNASLRLRLFAWPGHQ